MLAPGTRLGPYEVTAHGVGGMGEVYQATDTNLKRAVALKVLPAAVAGDTERLARFLGMAQHGAPIYFTETLATAQGPRARAAYARC